MYRVTSCLAILLVYLLGVAPKAYGANSQKRIESFAVYYSDKASLALLTTFDLLVLDADVHPDLEALSENGKPLLGYLSLGEIEKHRPYFSSVREQGLLLEENPHWPNSYYLDVRNPQWMQRVIEDLVPDLLHQGFDGIFMDTLDDPPHLERTDPEAYHGMIDAAVRLVRSIRYHYPNIPLMLNRAYELLPYVAEDIDMVLGESVYADFDFENKTYRIVEQKLYREQIRLLKQAQAAHPALLVLTLDYWDPGDPRKIRDIYRAQRKNGFVPYVATLALDRIVLEPNP